MGRKVGNARSVRVTVPESTTIVQGNFYYLDGFLGMATKSITTGAGETKDLILDIEPGEVETSQINTSDAFAKASKVYYDTTNKRFTNTASGNRFAGIVTQAKDANNVIWFVFKPTDQE